MRQLHPVGWREKFVASGRYVESRDGQATGAVEQWSIHEQSDGARITRVDRQGRRRDDFRLIEAWRNPLGDIERVELQAYGEAGPIRSSYVLFPDQIDLTRHLSPHEQHESLPIPIGALVHHVALVLAGEVVARVANSGRGQVVELDHRSGHAEIGEWQAEPVGADSVAIGADTLSARVYNVSYPDPMRATIWLSDDDVILRQMCDGALTVLSQYVRRTESVKP